MWKHTQREGVEDPGAFLVAGDLAKVLAETGQPGAGAAVAGRLYLSVGTVEVQLSRVYAKLGVRSRVQLTRALGAPA